MAVEVAAGYVSIYASLTHSEVANTVKNAMSGVTGQFLVQADTSAALDSLNTLSSVTDDWGNKLTRIGTVISAAATAFGGFAIKTASEAETTQIALGALSGSAENAQGMMKDLYQFAVTTPFTFSSVSQAAEKLMALGVSADNVKPTLTAVGDAVAAVGGGDSNIQNVTHDLGQMMATGKVTSRQMMNLANNNMSSWTWLTEYLNKDTTPAIKQMAQQGGDAWNAMLTDTRDKVKKGEIDAQTGFNAMLWGMENDYGGMMEKESHTVAFIMSNLGDAIKVPLTALKDMSGYKALADALSNLISPLQNFITACTPLINGMLETLAGLVKKVTDGLGGFVQVVDGAHGSTTEVLKDIPGVKSLLDLLLGIVVAGPGLKMFSKYSKGLKQFVDVCSNPLVTAVGMGSDALKTFSNLLKGGKLIPTDKLSGELRGVLEAFSNFGISSKSVLGDSFGFIKSILSDNISSFGALVAGKLATLGGKIALFFAPITTAVAGFFSNLGGKIASFVAPIGAKISAAFSNLGGFINKITGGLTQNLGGAISLAFQNIFGKLGGIFSTLFSQIGAVIGKFDFSKYFNGMLGIFGKFSVGAFGVGTALVAIGGAAAIAAGAFTMMGGDVGALVGTMTNDVANLSGMAADMIYSFGDALPGLNETLSSALPGLVTAVINGMKSIGDAVMAHAGDFLNLVVTITTQIGSFLAQAAPLLLQGAMVLFSGLLTALAQTINNLVAGGQLVAMVQQIGQVLVDNLPTLLTAAVTLFSALVQAFVQILPEVIAQVPIIIQSLIDSFPTWGPPLGAAALALFDVIVQALPQIVEALLSALESVIGMICDNLPGFAGWLLGAAVNLFLNIVTAVGQIAGSLLSAIGSLLSSAASSISKFDLGAAARDFIQGFVNGVNGAGHLIIEAVEGVFGWAVNAIKGILGIASPSKVMKEIGVYTMKGFAIGIDQSAYDAVSSVITASKQISDSFNPSLDMPDIASMSLSGSVFQGIGGNSGGTTINQNFDTKVVRSDDDLYVAAPIIYRNAMREAGLVSA